MHKDKAAELAMVLDGLEADVRRIENRIYYVRCEIEKAAGRKVGFHEAPSSPSPPASKAEGE